MESIIDLEGFIKHETESAILFSDGGVDAWIPKSKLEYRSEDGKEVSIPEWLAIEKGFI